jgi:hypothetical protein
MYEAAILDAFELEAIAKARSLGEYTATQPTEVCVPVRVCACVCNSAYRGVSVHVCAFACMIVHMCVFL